MLFFLFENFFRHLFLCIWMSFLFWRTFQSDWTYGGKGDRQESGIIIQFNPIFCSPDRTGQTAQKEEMVMMWRGRGIRVSWDGDHFAENKWVRSTRCPPSSCLVLQVNYILIKMEKLKLQDCFPKWLQFLYPYQMYRRVLTDPRSLHMGFEQPF